MTDSNGQNASVPQHSISTKAIALLFGARPTAPCASGALTRNPCRSCTTIIGHLYLLSIIYLLIQAKPKHLGRLGQCQRRRGGLDSANSGGPACGVRGHPNPLAAPVRGLSQRSSASLKKTARAAADHPRKKTARAAAEHPRKDCL